MLSLTYSLHTFVPLFLVKLSWITQSMRDACSSFPQHSIISCFKNYLQRVMPSLCRAGEALVGRGVSRKEMHFSSEQEQEAALALLLFPSSLLSSGA